MFSDSLEDMINTKTISVHYYDRLDLRILMNVSSLYKSKYVLRQKKGWEILKLS